MQHSRTTLVVLALAFGAEGATLLGDDVSPPGKQSRHSGSRILAGSSSSAVSQNLRLHLRDQIKSEEAKIEKMQADAGAMHAKPAWEIPADASKDRLDSESCKEPKPYKKTDYAGAFGPDKIFCCHTVRQVIEDVQYRCEVECNDAHPCHASMKEVYCPKYLAAYRKMEAVLCKERPTTTTFTTTTTTTTTIPVCLDGEHSPSYPCKCGDDDKLCESGEICDHSTGTCEYELALCPNGTVSEIYPCQCGWGKNHNKCQDGEVCVDWSKGECAAVSDADKELDSELAWCYSMCETRMSKHVKLDSAKAKEACSDEFLKDLEDNRRMGCEEFCKDLHHEGALRPEEDHAKHAK